MKAEGRVHRCVLTKRDLTSSTITAPYPSMVVSEPSLQQLRARYKHIYCPDVATLLLRRSGPMLPWLWPGIELIKADLSEIALLPFFPPPLFLSCSRSLLASSANRFDPPKSKNLRILETIILDLDLDDSA